MPLLRKYSIIFKDHEKEEGEMSAESDYDDRRNKDRKRAPSSPSNNKDRADNFSKKDQGEIEDGEDHHGKGRANGNGNDDHEGKQGSGNFRENDDNGGDHPEDDDAGLDPEEKEKRDREQRIAASLRKREEEVAKELSGHLHAREKERESHRRSEAVSAFQALLTDLIKHPDYSWKEAKKIFKKDSR